LSLPEREARILADLERQRREAIRRTFTRLDPVALGAGLAIPAAILGAVLPARLLFGNPPREIGETVGRIGHFFPGFDITPAGAVFGFVWFLVAGFAAGFLIASLRNAALRFLLWKMTLDAARWRRRHFLDEI